MTHAQPRGSKRASRPLPLPGATLANLPEILRALLASDNDARGVAEATLRQLSRDPHVVPSLLAIARSDADANARQMAAVILKRRVIAHWQRLGESTRDAVKQSLLEGVVREPMHLVKRAIADVLGKVAKATFATGSWSELPEFLAQCTQSPEESHRDVAYVVFASLTESIVSQARSFITIISHRSSSPRRLTYSLIIAHRVRINTRSRPLSTD
jgi:importin-4